MTLVFSSIDVFEDLSKNESDRYEYVFPNYKYTKEIFLDNSLFDTFNYKSSGNYRKFNTNVDELDLVNDLVFTSNNSNILIYLLVVTVPVHPIVIIFVFLKFLMECILMY